MSDRENLLAAETSDEIDRVLIERAVDGSRDALRGFVERHQDFVFNLALKMFGSRSDAEDLTQEVLVKVITSLKGFRHASSVKTWLYRITVNHFLKTKRRAMEVTVSDFETYFDEIAAVPEEEPDAALAIADATVEELRLRCTSGMLMCLDRDQRLAFILGAVFAVPTSVAAEILDITPGSYRVRLHRARRDLVSWMNARCGLVDASNPCSCRGKTAAYVKQGVVDPQRLVFNADYVVRIEDLTRRTSGDAMQRVDELHDRFFSSHPFALSKSTVVDDVLGDPTIQRFFSLD
jgi:RNA polymerase sigma factor (sigma-70 family)